LGGSGNGEAIAANKVIGIRCALCWNRDAARLAKQHNNANMIAIGARMIAADMEIEIVGTWLDAEFQAGRHVSRIERLRVTNAVEGPDSGHRPHSTAGESQPRPSSPAVRCIICRPCPS